LLPAITIRFQSPTSPIPSKLWSFLRNLWLCPGSPRRTPLFKFLDASFFLPPTGFRGLASSDSAFLVPFPTASVSYTPPHSYRCRCSISYLISCGHLPPSALAIDSPHNRSPGGFVFFFFCGAPPASCLSAASAVSFPFVFPPNTFVKRMRIILPWLRDPFFCFHICVSALPFRVSVLGSSSPPSRRHWVLSFPLSLDGYS